MTESNLSIESLKEKARSLVERGIISRHQPVSILFEYITASEWIDFERELEINGYILRDRIVDLLSSEKWDS